MFVEQLRTELIDPRILEMIRGGIEKKQDNTVSPLYA